MFWSYAYAQAGAAGQPSIFEQLIPFGFVFLIFYFLIIRPQGKKQKKHQDFLVGLKRGDEVLTASGMLGTVEGIPAQFITLEIADGVRIKMLKNQVSGLAKEEETK